MLLSNLVPLSTVLLLPKAHSLVVILNNTSVGKFIVLYRFKIFVTNLNRLKPVLHACYVMVQSSPIVEECTCLVRQRAKYMLVYARPSIMAQFAYLKVSGVECFSL